jgi:hypothetical protein
MVINGGCLGGPLGGEKEKKEGDEWIWLKYIIHIHIYTHIYIYMKIAWWDPLRQLKEEDDQEGVKKE